MKKILPTLLLLCYVLTTFSQAPQRFNYQAIVRNSSGQPVSAGTVVSLRFTIHDGTATGAPVFTETQTDTVNQFGLANVQIGISNNLNAVNWSSGAKYLEVELDPSGGNNFSNMGTSQLISVPYALFAANSNPGPQGPTGIAGNNGNTGPTGPTGAVGATGAGVTGVTGVQGLPGTTGPSGPTGATGATGIGLSGATGPVGPTGPSGLAGLQGITGATGIGATGPTGQTVAVNAWNLTGNTGITGGDFLGTLNNADLQFKVNGQPAGLIDSAYMQTIFGYTAGGSTSATYTTAFGYQALSTNAAQYNTAFGAQALRANQGGSQNTAVGAGAMLNGSGNFNTAIGSAAMPYNPSGSENTAVGAGALSDVAGSYNTGVGAQSLFNNPGSYNTAVGFGALQGGGGVRTSNYNAAFGYLSMYGNWNGGQNTACGDSSLMNNINGNYNTVLGFKADVDNDALTHATAIGAYAHVNENYALVLGGTGADAVNVGIGTSTPIVSLDVFSNDSIAGNFINSAGNGTAIRATVNGAWGGCGVQATVSVPGNGAIGYGILSSAQHTDGGWIYGVNTTGTIAGSGGFAYGTYSEGNITNGGGYIYGVYGLSAAGTGGFSYGVYGDATGASVQYGVYGTAADASPNNYAGYFNGNVYTTGAYQPSDRKLKNDIQPLTGALDIIAQLNPSTYTYKTTEYKQMHLPEGLQYGLIVDEVASVMPGAVKKTTQPPTFEMVHGKPGKEISPAVEFSALNYTEMVPILIAGMKEQQQIIEALKKEIDKLKKKQ